MSHPPTHPHPPVPALWLGALLMAGLAGLSRADMAEARLRVILDRAPFGPPPPTRSTTDETVAVDAGEAAVDDRPRLSETVRLHAMTRFNGIPAAGLVDLTTGRTFFLTEGQTLGGFRLEEVSFETSSIILTKEDLTEPVYLAYPDGQPSHIAAAGDAAFSGDLSHPTSAPSPDVTAAQTGHATRPDETAADPPAPAAAHAGYAPELIAAATIVEADGSTRLSFRELHRLRVQESREKAEQERLARETRAARERERAAAQAQADADAARLADDAAAAAETLRRKRIITSIKEGYPVDIDFELTPEEARDLANAGFDIAVDDITETAAPEPPAD